MNQSSELLSNIEDIVAKAKKAAIDAQRKWRNSASRDRFRAIFAVASELAQKSDQLVAAVQRPATPAEILTSEVFPLADACKFAGKQGPRILAPYSHQTLLGSWWMGRVGVSVRPEPWGLVLILAPWNYPLFLAGVQMIQAVAAGNAVLVKPSPGCEQVTLLLRDCMTAAGIPEELVQVLPSSIEAGEAAIRIGVDKVVLTGSVGTGRKVLHMLADELIPSTMELSGCDAVFVLPQADLKRAAKSIAFALKMNGGATCIAPRRIFVTAENKDALCDLLSTELKDAMTTTLRPQIFAQAKDLIDEALAGGARLLTGQGKQSDHDMLRTTEFSTTVLVDVQPKMRVAQADVFAPLASIIQVADMTEAVRIDSSCPYHLGASVFGPEPHASHWAEQIQAGCITLNDTLIPTADPRVSFGGRGHSGWGVTRGPEGLLEMTRPKVICERRGRWMPHFDRKVANNQSVLTHLLKFFHARTLSERLRNGLAFIRSQSR
jgi:acyl-CoA reductase-like NAD-dependent aldehyde dehydrogenase